ncbi:metallophosphoesterase family protein [Neptunicoccus sediminis]|uniref:metallophosphoesterase family protein n=1 Tax=Neptunicoccus sediminis TaxID=1892596 RepID=UPI000845C16C|nr:metallophosphoesterase [Neptunicoccus sediminis]
MRKVFEPVIFYGDPHGDWQPLLDEIDEKTDTVFIMGDLAEAKRHPEHLDSAREALRMLISKGIRVRFIVGNHDTDTDAIHALVFEEFREMLLECQVLTIGQSQFRVAGLGGVIRGKVWTGDDEPTFYSPADLMAVTPKHERFRGGLPRKQQGTIFPSSVATLAQRGTDILLTHEAPSCHPRGFGFIDDLSQSMGASLIVHGHHHVAYSDRLNNGVLVRGLGRAEVWKPNLTDMLSQQKMIMAGRDSLSQRWEVYDKLKDC